MLTESRLVGCFPTANMGFALFCVFCDKNSTIFAIFAFYNKNTNIMKRTGIIIATIALVAIGVFAFATPSKTPDNPKTSKNNYETMWKKVKENLDNNLPESAEKELNAIEQQASKDKNQVQLLKTYLYRQKIFQFTIEEDPDQHFIQYAESKVGQLDEICNALLHEEIAKAYAEYLEANEWRINENLAID